MNIEFGFLRGSGWVSLALLLALAPKVQASTFTVNGTELGTLTGDGTSNINYSLYHNEAFINGHDSSNPYGGAGVTGSFSSSWILQLNFVDSVNPVTPSSTPFGSGYQQILNGTGTLNILYGSGPNSGQTYVTGTLGNVSNQSYILASPNSSSSAFIQLAFNPTAGPQEYLQLQGTTSPSVSLCVPDNTIGMCNNTNTYTPGSNQFNSFALDWKANVSSTPYALAPVPEPETYAMMLAGLGLLGFIATRRSKAAKKA